MSRALKKWYPEPAPAAPSQIRPKEWGVAYWKKIKDVKGIGGKIIARVCGDTKEEAESLARYICDMHNDHLHKSV